MKSSSSSSTRAVARSLAGAAIAALAMTAAHAASDVRVLLGVDPADTTGDVLLSASLGPAQSLGRALGSRVTITQTSRMFDVMRASRTVENDIIIAPAHVTASAILHEYQLLATSGQDQVYVLMAKKGIDSVDKLPHKRLYLPQQDSLRSYVAKGLLTDSGVKLNQFSKVTYGNTSGAGLVALSFDMADVTITDEAQAKQWIATHPGGAHILKTTRPVPGGMSIVVRKDFCVTECARIAEWINSPDGVIPGIGRFRIASADAGKQFTYVASLGIATPEGVKGATRVSADQVADLMKQGVTLVDTRTQKEYDSEHVRGAILAPYGEKSLKEIDFDASKDDYHAIDALPKDKPLILMCNGTECWKSYKATRHAVVAGFKTIYWFRGGMPEWREKRLPVDGTAGASMARTTAPAKSGGRAVVAASH
ncbi:MAG TPA: rhodanese-like domain-containing protein [Caldimonas sp.]|nr:rhodanese-like domain-containing protein [Caldimonas sp.]